jgi:hypothetical protein
VQKAILVERLDVHALGDVVAVGVDEHRVAVDGRDVGVAPEELDGSGDGVGGVGVVGVKPAEDRALGAVKSFVQRVTLPVVAFADPLEAVAEAFELRDRVVGGTPVHDEVFDIAIILRED